MHGLDYAYQRYYSSIQGRFVTPDPSMPGDPSDPQSFNLYSYVLQDPIKTAEGYAVLTGEEGIRDFLGLVAEHPDPALASRAKAELRRLVSRHSG